MLKKCCTKALYFLIRKSQGDSKLDRGSTKIRKGKGWECERREVWRIMWLSVVLLCPIGFSWTAFSFFFFHSEICFLLVVESCSVFVYGSRVYHFIADWKCAGFIKVVCMHTWYIYNQSPHSITLEFFGAHLFHIQFIWSFRISLSYF